MNENDYYKLVLGFENSVNTFGYKVDTDRIFDSVNAFTALAPGFIDDMQFLMCNCNS